MAAVAFNSRIYWHTVLKSQLSMRSQNKISENFFFSTYEVVFAPLIFLDSNKNNCKCTSSLKSSNTSQTKRCKVAMCDKLVYSWVKEKNIKMLANTVSGMQGLQMFKMLQLLTCNTTLVIDALVKISCHAIVNALAPTECCKWQHYDIR